MDPSRSSLLTPRSLSVIIISTIVFSAFILTPAPARAGHHLHYHFKVPGTLHETGSMSESSSPYFWLNSGGILSLRDGIGMTAHEKMETHSRWRTEYYRSNPLDTDNGYLPQNLFRLVTKDSWTDLIQEVRFRIDQAHTTNTPNRDGHSGILLMSRYQNGSNLYYAGIRMDGDAVIKKKKNGAYTTLAQKEVFAGRYDRLRTPNLLPEEQWMRLKTVTRTLKNRAVEIHLYVDRSDTGKWEKVLSAIDTNGPLLTGGHAGIRTDYMDVSFDDYILR